jgi:hypothetical protein
MPVSIRFDNARHLHAGSDYIPHRMIVVRDLFSGNYNVRPVGGRHNTILTSTLPADPETDCHCVAAGDFPSHLR